MSASSLWVTWGTFSHERCRNGPDSFLILGSGTVSTWPNLEKSWAGISGMPAPAVAVTVAAAGGAAGAWAAGGGAGAGVPGVASGGGSCWPTRLGGVVSGPAPSPPTTTTTVPSLTVSPTLTLTSCTFPAAVAGTSMVALSDSSVTRGSSSATTSPGDTCTSITGTSW